MAFLGFGYTLLETTEEINRYITANRRLQKTRFYVGDTPAVTLVKKRHHF